MRTSRFVVALLLSIATALPAFAGWDEGVKAFSDKNYQVAAQHFQELVSQNPEGYRGHYMLGLSLQQLGRKEEALNHLRKAYDLNPSDLTNQLALGRAYYNLRRYGDVTKLLNSVDPSSLGGSQQAAFYQMRGRAKLKTNDDSGGAQDLKKLVQLKPNDAEVQFLYGTVALKAGDTEAGLAALRKATQLDTKDPEKKRAYAQGLIKKGRYTKNKTEKQTAYLAASEVAGKLAASAPTYENLMLKVSAELGAKQYDQAADSAKAALAKKSTDWLAHYYLGQAYSSAGKFKEAEKPLLDSRGIAKKPEDLKLVWTQLGYVYEKQKKYTQSIEAYQFAGNQSGVERVKRNEETDLYNKQVEAENEQIREMEEEAKRLEEELKALEGGGGTP